MSESKGNKSQENADFSSVPGHVATGISAKYSFIEAMLKRTNVLTNNASWVLKGVGGAASFLLTAAEVKRHLDNDEDVKAVGAIGNFGGGLVGGAVGGKLAAGASASLVGGSLATVAGGLAGGLVLGYVGMRGAQILYDYDEGMKAVLHDFQTTTKATAETIDSLARPATEALGGKLQEAGKELSPKIQATMKNLGGHIEKGLEPVSVAAKEYVAPAVAKVTTEYVAPAAKAVTEKAIAPAAEKLTTGVIGPAAKGIAESVSSVIQGFFSLFKDDPKSGAKNKKSKAGSPIKDAASKVSISASSKTSKTTHTKQAETKPPGASQAAQTDLASISSEISVNPEYSSEAKQSGSVVDKATSDPALVADQGKDNAHKQDDPQPQPDPKKHNNNLTRKVSPPLSALQHQANQPNEAQPINQSIENKEGDTSLLRNNNIAPQLEAEYTAAAGAAPNITFNQQLYFPPGTDREQAKAGVADANAAAQSQIASSYQSGQGERSVTLGSCRA